MGQGTPIPLALEVKATHWLHERLSEFEDSKNLADVCQIAAKSFYIEIEPLFEKFNLIQIPDEPTADFIVIQMVNNEANRVKIKMEQSLKSMIQSSPVNWPDAWHATILQWSQTYCEQLLEHKKAEIIAQFVMLANYQLKSTLSDTMDLKADDLLSKVHTKLDRLALPFVGSDPLLNMTIQYISTQWYQEWTGTVPPEKEQGDHDYLSIDISTPDQGGILINPKIDILFRHYSVVLIESACKGALKLEQYNKDLQQLIAEASQSLNSEDITAEDAEGLLHDLQDRARHLLGVCLAIQRRVQNILSNFLTLLPDSWQKLNNEDLLEQLTRIVVNVKEIMRSYQACIQQWTKCLSNEWKAAKTAQDTDDAHILLGVANTHEQNISQLCQRFRLLERSLKTGHAEKILEYFKEDQDRMNWWFCLANKDKSKQGLDSLYNYLNQSCYDLLSAELPAMILDIDTILKDLSLKEWVMPRVELSPFPVEDKTQNFLKAVQEEFKRESPWDLSQIPIVSIEEIAKNKVELQDSTITEFIKGKPVTLPESNEINELVQSESLFPEKNGWLIDTLKINESRVVEELASHADEPKGEFLNDPNLPDLNPEPPETEAI